MGYGKQMRPPPIFSRIKIFPFAKLSIVGYTVSIADAGMPLFAKE